MPNDNPIFRNRAAELVAEKLKEGKTPEAAIRELKKEKPRLVDLADATEPRQAGG